MQKWQTGMTGIPIVDAGMRELWQTGYMHNRLRMIVGSFLVKNLMIHWRWGEKWFGIRFWMLTWPTTVPVGSGWLVSGQILRHIFEFSTP